MGNVPVDTALMTQDGQIIKPMLANTDKTGSGTWLFVVVDSAGHIQLDLAGAIPAGTALIGKVGIDQTTPGTTNAVVEASASAIKTALEVIDNMISGSEAQVDVVAALPAGTNNIGDVDVLSIAAGTALIGKTGIDQVTANANEVVIKSGTITTVTAVTGITNALPAGTAAIGKLAANSGVDIGDVDITSIAAGTALIGKMGIDQTTLGTTNGVVRVKGSLLNSGVKSADAAIKASAGALYWLTVSDTAALAIEINDSTANGGSDVWGLDLPAGGYAHFIFDPPIECGTGIYLDVSTATCKVTVGYI